MNVNKRFKPDPTSLEHLPNELFIEIFRYLNGVDAVYAFSKLNVRFEQMTLDYNHVFDFKSVSKAKFDLATEYHNRRQWLALSLSTAGNSPNQITYFCHRYSLANDFIQLRSLRLEEMPLEDRRVLLPQLNAMINLVSLSVGSFCGEELTSLTLPQLKQLTVTTCAYTSWMKNLTQIESLQHTVSVDCFHLLHMNTFSWPQQLSQLKISYEGYRFGLMVRTTLCGLSRLTSLSIRDTRSQVSEMTGQVWEELIRSSMPMLRTFQFHLIYQSSYFLLPPSQQIFESFATPFYLCEKCWYVQGHKTSPRLNLNLYSVPFAFEELNINVHAHDYIFTTLPPSSPNRENRAQYNNVKTLSISELDIGNARKYDIDTFTHLIMQVSTLPRDWLCLCRNVRHISLVAGVSILPGHFILLAESMPRLDALTLPMTALENLTDKWTNGTVCEHLRSKIRSLDVSVGTSVGALAFTGRCVRVGEVRSLTRVFGENCEHFTVYLQSRNVIPDVILRHMKALRSLRVGLREKLIDQQWLEKYPKAITDSDFWTDHLYWKDGFFVWFGNRP